MNQPATFTGRKKSTATRAAVLLSDKIAHFVITLGGLATIAAVLLVGVFLFVVAQKKVYMYIHKKHSFHDIDIHKNIIIFNFPYELISEKNIILY